MLDIILTLLIFLVPQANQQAVVTHLESISYPEVAHDAQIQGSVELSVEVSESGTVISAVALSGHPILKRAAETNIERWKFAAGTPRKLSMTYEFSLQEPRTSHRPDTKDYFDLPSRVRVVSELPARTD